MPELPEVEITRRGIVRHILHQSIKEVVVRESRLRWPVPKHLTKRLQNSAVLAVDRRAKYLLLSTENGWLIIHLGMSGSLRLVDVSVTPEKHDHVDVVFSNGQCLRLRDPRRFGCVLWTHDDPLTHPLLSKLGPEPWDQVCDGDYLYHRARHRRRAVKNFIMDSHIVVGVGNIYANEALFLSGIRPDRAAGRISRQRYTRLMNAIRQVLEEAIAAGGTTLRDFVASDGRPGYFRGRLRVYGRQHKPCVQCRQPIQQTVIGRRSTYYCPRCQR